MRKIENVRKRRGGREGERRYRRKVTERERYRQTNKQAHRKR